jgi:hypothetical protein
MFDLSSLNGSSEEYSFSRDIPPFSKTGEGTIKYYEHFQDPYGREIIVLPPYTSNKDELLLIHNRFKVVRGLSVPNEECCFAYRPPKNGELRKVEKKYDLVIMTTFYEETDEELQNFFDYYRKQGVEHFYMYYNGSLYDRGLLPYGDDISYHEWDFQYWYYKDGVDRKYHHAQIPAMVSFHKKFLPYCGAALMIDTDEFLRVESGESLESYVKRHEHLGRNLFSNHHWASVDRDGTILGSRKDQANRGKTVVYSKICGIDFTPNVHRTKNSMNAGDLHLYHNKKGMIGSAESPPRDQARRQETGLVFEVPDEMIEDHPRVSGHPFYEFKDYSRILKPTRVYSLKDITVNRDFILDHDGNFLSQFTWVGDEIVKYNQMLAYYRGVGGKERKLEGETLYLGSTWGSYNIGHDVMDGLSRMACYEAAGLDVRSFDHVLLNAPNSETAKIVELMGVRPSQIRYLSERPWICENLVISEMPGRKRQYKKIVGDYFRKTLNGVFKEKSKDNIIFLMNRRSRKPINMSEVLDVAKEHDAAVFRRYPSAKDMYNASVIVSPHSSTLYKLFFCRPGTKVIELISSVHQYSYYYELCRILDLEYHGIMCDADATSDENDLRKDINVDIPSLREILSK